MIIRGTELKLNIHVDPIDGYTMFHYDFTVEAYTTKNSKKTFKKVECIYNTGNDYIICLDTSDLKEGELIIKFIAYIPDNNFKDGHRTEINVIKTGIKIKKA